MAVFLKVLLTRWRRVGFTHKMAAWKICLQDGGVSEFYSQDGGVSEGFTYGNVKKNKNITEEM